MRHFFAFTPLPLAVIALAAAAFSTPPGSPGEDSIRAVERQWDDAEYRADTAALRKLLLPGYRTVSPRGVHTRDDVIAVAAKRGKSPGEPPDSTLPTLTVEIHGATALATFTVPDTSYNVDVFVLENGRWHAMYSQHTPIKKEP